MYWTIFCDIIKDKILFQEKNYGRPKQSELLLTICFIVYLDGVKLLFLSTENGHGVTKSCAVEQKAEEGDRRYIRLLKVLENPNHFFINHSSRDYPDYNLIRGEFGRNLGREIASWLGNGETAYAVASFLSLHF